jgi:hypothetical protein
MGRERQREGRSRAERGRKEAEWEGAAGVAPAREEGAGGGGGGARRRGTREGGRRRAEVRAPSRCARAAALSVSGEIGRKREGEEEK